SRSANGITSSRAAARRFTRPGSRRAAGRSARTTPESSKIMWSSGRCEAALEAALAARVDVRRVRSARRLRLRFDEASGVLKLTCPWRTSRKSALAWALDQRDWIEQQLARAEPGEPFVAGAMIPIEGRPIRINWREQWPRTPRLAGDELRC